MVQRFWPAAAVVDIQIPRQGVGLGSPPSRPDRTWIALCPRRGFSCSRYVVYRHRDEGSNLQGNLIV